MHTRLAALTAAALLTASAASASTVYNRGATETTVECSRLLAVTEQTVKEQQDYGQKTRNQVDELMTKLRGQCAANELEQAEETAAYIRGLVATE